MNYVIFDLESTCWDDTDSLSDSNSSEIIEIGAVKLDSDYNKVEEFQSFIKPIIYPLLSDFCKKLTSIRQEDVDSALLFPIVKEQFREFCNNGKDTQLVSWGYYDKGMLIREHIRRGSSDYDWVNNHMNLKVEFSKQYKGRHCGMKKALRVLGISLEGTHHRGINDAKNTSKVFIKMFKKESKI